MREFKDADGKAWKIDLNVGTAIHVKQASDGRFNLFDPESKPGGECGDRTLGSIMFAEQLSDWMAIWEVLYHIIGPQANDTTAAEFGKAMPIACLVQAQKAFLQEWRDFFDALQRPDVVTMLEKKTAYHEKALELVREKLKDGALATLDARVEQKMRSTLNSSLGDLEASFDSILGPSPSGSSSI